jgi:tetratricopeptide repeat protein
MKMKNEELDLAWQFIKNTGTHLFLTGKAGTGKTTFLKNLREQLPKRMVVLAPTGIAAINANGVTIHSFFQLPFSPYIPNTTFRSNATPFHFGKEKQRIIRTMDLLVIDEISMVRADLLDTIDVVLRRYRDRSKPFGGVQLLMIGDLQQLAPVVKEEEWKLLQPYYDSPYFFSSKALQQTEYMTIELKTVYRQSDEMFLSLLNKIRENKADENIFQLLNRRYIPNFNPPQDAGYIRLTTHNYQAQQINNDKLAELPGKAFSFQATVSGNFPEQSYPTDETLILKEQAQVMFVKNDTSGAGRYYNGMLGRVVGVSAKGISVRNNADDSVIEVEKEEWFNTKYVLNKKTQEITEEVEGTFRQYPLRQAWAVTIHKSQGLTFEHAIIDAQHSFAHGQTYVALSRCKTLEGLVLSAPLTSHAIICDEKVNAFNLTANHPDTTTVSRLEKAYALHLLDELFDFRPLGTAFERMLRLLDEHFHKKYHRLLTEYKQLRPIVNELVDVAFRFRLQYTRLLTSASTRIEDQTIQTRIQAAATYFSEKLQPLLALQQKTSPETDSKTLKKTLAERLTEWNEAIIFKTSILQYESSQDTVFSVSDYLHTKARMLLEAMERHNGNARKEKRKPKERISKPDTRLLTYELYKQGKSIEVIAQERNLTLSTIASHLAFYIVRGDVDVNELVDTAKQLEIVHYLTRFPQEKKTAGDVKQNVSNEITYTDIKLVLASYYR